MASQLAFPSQPTNSWWLNNLNAAATFNSISSNGIRKSFGMESAVSCSTGYTDTEGRSRSTSIPLQIAMEQEEQRDDVDTMLQIKTFEMFSLIRNSRASSQSVDVKETDYKFEFVELENETYFEDNSMLTNEAQEYLIGDSFEEEMAEEQRPEVDNCSSTMLKRVKAGQQPFYHEEHQTFSAECTKDSSEDEIFAIEL